MMVTPANLRRQVITRAANCCEYCCLAQTGQEATFHVDHVVPVVAGGQSTSENLALACVSCSLRKGARLVSQGYRNGERAIGEIHQFGFCKYLQKSCFPETEEPPAIDDVTQEVDLKNLSRRRDTLGGRQECGTGSKACFAIGLSIC